MYSAEGVVNAASRLHFGLLDLPAHFGRRYGGVGVMLDSPSTLVRWHTSAEELAIVSATPLDDSAHCQVGALLDRLESHIGDRLNGRIEVVHRPPSHRGYGSKSALLLAIAEAVYRSNGREPYHDELARLSGRGGASGVGVHGYRTGGLVLDAGHPARTRLGPSSLGRQSDIPLLAAHHAYPASWRIALLDLPMGYVLAQREEVQLFSAAARSIDSREAGTSIAAAYHQVFAGVASSEFELFRDGLHSLRRNAFKRIEVASQHEVVRQSLTKLEAHDGVACSMSSVGPLVFAICRESDESAIHHIMETATEHSSRVHWTFARNCGLTS
ncbi:beta-ribofuranosylaminobenzene 5'-phosphate synthase family protein [Tetrasphaera sp. F2B08]|uniref:beta-ribofuranosylaminobenzene 5'-phosphate synthase family protein n=1 Tax=Nostocoides sp. F2B08 TaxID=2653936 RepID=UPI001D04FFAC